MQVQTPAGAFTNNYVIDMYHHYLDLYQNRYAGMFFFPVTWKHISYWRKQVTYLGAIMIERGLLCKGQYLQDKKTVNGTSAMIERVKNCTADNIQAWGF